MTEGTPLTPLSGKPEGRITRSLTGPLRPPPHKSGNIDMLCPHCSAVLIEATDGSFADIPAIQCYSCKQRTTGKGMRGRSVDARG